MQRDFERPVTVTVSGKNGVSLCCSAVFERDPDYLDWNRLSLVGREPEQLEIMSLMGNGLVEWRLHENNYSDNDKSSFEHFGSAIIRSVGFVTGTNISKFSIQKIADLELFNSIERVVNDSFEGPPNSTYWFLQRTPDWVVYPKSWKNWNDFDRFGRWYKIPKSNFRFRLATIGLRRNEPRRSAEIEFIEIPAVEVSACRNVDNEDEFSEFKEAFWFLFRIGHLFWFRQPAEAISEHHHRTGCREWISHPIKIEPLQSTESLRERLMNGRFENFFQSLISSLLYKDHLYGQLHASVFAYASSFRSDVSERALTSAVEAIEYLVVAFEEDKAFSRDALTRIEWQKFTNIIKENLPYLDIDKIKKNAIRRYISYTPTLTLQERIIRMNSCLRRKSRPDREFAFDNLEGMIKMRNALVHGRQIDNINKLYIETVRARCIFEDLFIRYTGTGRFVEIISHNEEMLKN